MPVDLLDNHDCVNPPLSSPVLASNESEFQPISQRRAGDVSLDELSRIMKEREATVRCNGCGLTIPAEIADDHKCPRPKLKRAPEVLSFKSVQEMTEEELMIHADNKLNEKQIQDEALSKYTTATTFGDRHSRRRNSALDALTAVVVANQGEFSTLAELVQYSPGVYFPRLFTILGGAKTKPKTNLASQLMWLYVLSMKNQRAAEGECPYLQPKSEDTYLRSAMAVLKDQFDWRFSLLEDFNFPGGLSGKVTQLRQDRSREWPDTYGTAANRQIPEATHVSQLDLQVFDEDDLPQHQKKCMVVFGTYFAFRGATEHTNLLVSQVELGYFERGHPLEGQEFVRVNNIVDKSHQLSMRNTVKRDTKNMMRIPVNRSDICDPGGTIARFLDKLSPGQKRFYCNPASRNERMKFHLSGHPYASMSPSKPIGVNTLRKMIKEANSLCGVGENVAGQGLRRLGIMTLVNDGEVNSKETLAWARHKNPLVQQDYVMRNAESEMSRFRAQRIDMQESNVGQLKSPQEQQTAEMTRVVNPYSIPRRKPSQQSEAMHSRVLVNPHTNAAASRSPSRVVNPYAAASERPSQVVNPYTAAPQRPLVVDDSYDSDDDRKPPAKPLH
eukprot:scaffold19380_cov81-Skeletonema_menzelii.AAC.2